jgi:hypothetical protein
VLANLPDDFLIEQSGEVLEKLPIDCGFFSRLPPYDPQKQSELDAAYVQKKEKTDEGLGLLKFAKGNVNDSIREQRDKSDTGSFRTDIPDIVVTAPGMPILGFFLRHVQDTDKGKGKNTEVEIDEDPALPTPPPKERRSLIVKLKVRVPDSSASNSVCVNCFVAKVKCTGNRPRCCFCTAQSLDCHLSSDSAGTQGLTKSKTGTPMDLLIRKLENPQADGGPVEQEETFANRPSIRITIPDHLKSLLVDDWENVTKSLLLVPLPSQAPANFIIDTYFHEEKQNRRLGSPEADVFHEFCAGMKVYFEKSVSKILLYRFERGQLAEVRSFFPKHDFFCYIDD